MVVVLFGQYVVGRLERLAGLFIILTIIIITTMDIMMIAIHFIPFRFTCRMIFLGVVFFPFGNIGFAREQVIEIALDPKDFVQFGETRSCTFNTGGHNQDVDLKGGQLTQC